MNIFILLAVIAMYDIDDYSIDDLYAPRAARRAARQRVIARNRKNYYNRTPHGVIWFEYLDENGDCNYCFRNHIHHNDQRGRWSNSQLSGHRRLQKWSKDYYPSWYDEKHKCWDAADRRWEQRYAEFE